MNIAGQLEEAAKAPARATKLAKEAVELARLILRPGTIRARSEQRIYDRMMKKIDQIATITGMDSGDVADQIDAQARKMGAKMATPGKNF